MELNIYSIYDTAAKAYATPFFMPNDGLAIRAFSDNVNSSDSQLSKHPEQFVLFKIGTFEDQHGKLDHYDPVVNLGQAMTFKTETFEEGLIGDVNHKIDHQLAMLERLIEKVNQMTKEIEQ